MADSVDFNIRPAEKAECAALLHLENRVYGAAWTWSMIQGVVADPQSIALVARDSTDGLLGASMGHLAADEFELYKLSVYPEFRRRGVGRALLAATLRSARSRGAAQAFLEVRRLNQAALALYRRLGFSVLSIRPHYYGDTGEDALVMGLPLLLEKTV